MYVGLLPKPSLLPFTLSREQSDRLDGYLWAPWQSTNLQPQLEELQHLLDSLAVLHNAKKNALLNSVTANNKGQHE